MHLRCSTVIIEGGPTRIYVGKSLDEMSPAQCDTTDTVNFPVICAPVALRFSLPLNSE